MSNDKSSKKLGKGTIAIIAIGLVVIIALIVTIVILVGKMKDNSNPADSQKRNVVVTPENVSEMIEQLSTEEYSAPGTYEVTMNTTWNFKDGKSPSSNAYVENVINNTNDVYFDVLLSNTEEVVYSSPVLPRGSHIENITLDKELANGTYDCVLKYTLVDKDQNPLSELKVSVQLVIGE